MSRIRSLVVSLFVIAVAAGTGRADDLTGRWSVGGSAGAAIPIGANYVKDQGKLGPDFGFLVRRGLSPHWAAGVSYDNINLKDGIRLESILANGIYSFCPHGRWTPVAQAGLGIGSGQGAKPFNNLAAKVGAGAEYFLNSDVSLNAMLNYDFVSASGSALHNAHALVPTVGINFFFDTAAAAPAPTVVAVPTPAPTPAQAPEKVSIELKVLFDTDKAVIKPGFDEEIKRVADFMNTYPNTQAEIEGHTDSQGSREHNLGLSQRRADAVRSYLVKHFNIDASRLTAKGYGPDRPVETNDTSEGRAKNRRVVATLTATKTQ